jgi:hypothetical protein
MSLREIPKEYMKMERTKNPKVTGPVAESVRMTHWRPIVWAAVVSFLFLSAVHKSLEAKVLLRCG